MTSVPKPLKSPRPHYRDLQTLYETWPVSEDKVGLLDPDHDFLTYGDLQSLFADIVSVLAMTYSRIPNLEERFDIAFSRHPCLLI